MAARERLQHNWSGEVLDDRLRARSVVGGDEAVERTFVQPVFGAAALNMLEKQCPRLRC